MRALKDKPVSIYRRKSGRYAVLVDLEPTAIGGRRRKSIGTYRTRREADAAERKALEARDRGTDLSPQTVTVAELLEKYAERCRTKALQLRRWNGTRSLHSAICCRLSVVSLSHG